MILDTARSKSSGIELGDHDPMYSAGARQAIEAMQGKMDSVELYLDAGHGHFCDPALGLEAIRALLVN